MSEFVVRLEGLPFRVSKEELKEFFGDCDMPNGLDSVHLIMNPDGRASGVGYVEFSAASDLETALKLDGQDIASYRRYAKVSECDPMELRWFLGRKKQGDAPLFRVRMQGLPFRVSEYEVSQFFEPEAQCVDVEIHLNNEGRSSGLATAFFSSIEAVEAAMAKNKAELRGRYINLTNESAKPLSRSGYQVRMKGLPFRATEQEIKDFFLPDADCVSARIILGQDGRPSGDAVAEFETNEQAEAAMKKNRENLGTRFVILTREDGGSDNFGDNRGGGRRGGYRGGRGGGGRDRDNYDDDDFNSSGGSKGSGEFTIRMGGLPYRSTVNEIMDWFRPEAECAHVRIIMNREGRPSGEAIAEFASKEEADQAMTKNRKYMGQRFVILTSQYSD